MDSTMITCSSLSDQYGFTSGMDYGIAESRRTKLTAHMNAPYTMFPIVSNLFREGNDQNQKQNHISKRSPE